MLIHVIHKNYQIIKSLIDQMMVFIIPKRFLKKKKIEMKCPYDKNIQN